MIDVSSRYESFTTWTDVVDYAENPNRPALYYRAPLDCRPVRVSVRRVFKNGKIRIDPMSAHADCFTADYTHLGRFLKERKS